MVEVLFGVPVWSAGFQKKMTVLQDDVIPKRSKLSTKQSYKKAEAGVSEAGTRGRPSKRKTPDVSLVPSKRANLENDIEMLNGYRSNDHRSGDSTQCPAATLANMGNTCFLNSVLYALRFAPTFLHNLHHLIDDLSIVNSRLNQTKIKSSSLGRNVGAISGPSSRSTSSKDLLSLGNSNDIIPKSKVQIVTEKLHELFMTMHNLEVSENREAYQPVAFLQSVREANYIFEGNHQQDAHELLFYLLDNIRETCDVLAEQVEHNPDILSECAEPMGSGNNSKLWRVPRSWKKTKKKKEKPTDSISEEKVDNGIVESEDTASNEMNVDNGRKKLVYNFIAEDFEGVTLIRTRCLECECVTERKELFYDIRVPILKDEEDYMSLTANEIFKRACVTKEKLCDTNKYSCENCLRLTEASREISFEKLPNMIVLQLKRFTTTAAGAQKVVSFLPTPIKLACFCDSCCKIGEAEADEDRMNDGSENSPVIDHHYELCCIIMHLGGSMASGHYIAYVRASDRSYDYLDCSRDIVKGGLSASSSEKSLNLLKYLKPRFLDSKAALHKNTVNGVQVCKSSECCGVRLSKNVLENVFNSSYTKRNGHEWQEDIWLECDDENIRAMSCQEFQEILSCKENATSTPYLLFYSKINTANGMED